MDEKAKKRGYICMEILTSEQSYVDQLRDLAAKYMEPLTAAGVLNESAKRAIFINLDTLIQIHTQLVQTLRNKLDGKAQADGTYQVGDALSSITPVLTLYVDYINRYHEGGETLIKLNQQRQFARVLDKCSHNQSLHGMAGLQMLRVVPVQRIPRYVLLLREVLKVTPDTHPDYAACQKAYNAMEAVATKINEKKREYEGTQRLAFISLHLGGNLGALRESTKDTGRAHVFLHQVMSTRCDWCKTHVLISGFRCQVCGYNAHPNCYKNVPHTCGAAQLEDRETTPQLIKASRRILLEGYLDVRTSDMQRPGEYERIPFQKRLVVLCNDSLIVLSVEGGTPRAGKDETAQDQADQRFSLVDLVSWRRENATGGGANIAGNVGDLLFSVAHVRTHTLHTFKCADDPEKTKWLDACVQAQKACQEQERRHDEQESQVTEQLTGLTFQITGTVKVQSQLEKPFMVYMIVMKNDKATMTILKRYRQMLALHKKLVQLYGENALAKFPPKKLIGNTDERFLQKRSHELSLWLDSMVKLKDVLKVPEVRHFLTTTVSAKNEDELLPNFVPAGSQERLLDSIVEEADSDSDDDSKKQQQRGQVARVVCIQPASSHLTERSTGCCCCCPCC